MFQIERTMRFIAGVILRTVYTAQPSTVISVFKSLDKVVNEFVLNVAVAQVASLATLIDKVFRNQANDNETK